MTGRRGAANVFVDEFFTLGDVIVIRDAWRDLTEAYVMVSTAIEDDDAIFMINGRLVMRSTNKRRWYDIVDV